MLPKKEEEKYVRNKSRFSLFVHVVMMPPLRPLDTVHTSVISPLITALLSLFYKFQSPAHCLNKRIIIL